ncbi:MAG: GIY-YIG nuclease family protein [Opitutae bacterium]|nr:GIY-YIG nuclease family protein [Opitutae bacterium]
MYYVYVLQSQTDDGLYIGYSSDLRRRLAQHQAGNFAKHPKRSKREIG